VKITDFDSTIYTVLLEGNPIICSCRMKWLKDAEHIKQYRLQFCQHPALGQLTRLDTMRVEEFVCKIDVCLDDQPTCDCYTENEQQPNSPTLIVCSNGDFEHFPRYLQLTTKILYYDGNRLISIKTGFFTVMLPNLRELYLDRNRISQIDDGAFYNVRRLMILGLSENHLNCISARMFSNLYNLTILRLNGNRILAIERRSFGDLHDLNNLLLHDNQLTDLNDSTMAEIDEMSSLTNMTLYGNPWTCYFDNATFKNWIQYHADIISNASGIQCNGISVLTLPDEHFIKPTKPNVLVTENYFIMPLASVLTASVLVMVSALFLYIYRHRVQVILYSRLGFRLRRAENPECPTDVFVVYDTNNMAVCDWVNNILAARIAARGDHCRLVTSDDLPFGCAVINSISTVLKISKRTVSVINNSAVDRES